MQSHIKKKEKMSLNVVTPSMFYSCYTRYQEFYKHIHYCFLFTRCQTQM
ncbi:hypothetical protein OIU77_011610 [Salix suchowensis]|uniref:Uncharacterized protein n=1 Tax=Salix suchowensis TaxID=1278906 RepID=A0ABQ9A0U6_9ROSI|nr:hypothetical protein OIU77_011610 [Salix suchowensis]